MMKLLKHSQFKGKYVKIWKKYSFLWSQKKSIVGLEGFLGYIHGF